MLGCTVKAPSTLGDLPAQLPLGPRPPARPRQPRIARPRLGGTERDPARRRSRSTSTRRSVRPTAWRRRAPATTATRACAAITRCSPLAAGTGDVLMARLREGRANTARRAAHFLRETVARVRDAGASGQLTVPRRQRLLQPRRRRRLPQAGCPLLGHDPPAAERAHPDRGDPGSGLDADPVLAAGRRRCRRDDLHAVPGTRRTPARCGSSCGASSRRPAHSSRSSWTYSYHAFITDRAGELMELEAGHRRHAEIENAIRDLKYGVGLNHLPSGRFAANAAWLAVQVDRAQPRPLDGAAGARRGNRHHQDAQAALLLARRTAHPLGTALDPAPPEALALGRAAGSRARATTGDTAPGLTPGSQRRPGPEARASMPAHASRTLATAPSAPPSRACSLRHRPANAGTPAELSASPASPPSSFDRWIRA